MLDRSSPADMFDPALADELALLLKEKASCSVASTEQQYVEELNERGVDCRLLAPDAGSIMRAQSFNSKSQEHAFGARSQAVLCLNLGRLLSVRPTPRLLDNLAENASKLLILNYSTDKHYPCGRTSLYLIVQQRRQGFSYEPQLTSMLRASCSSDAFKNTLLVFSRGQRPYSLADARAIWKILKADFTRLSQNSRSNSSAFDALIGKILRIGFGAGGHLTKWLNTARLYRYDLKRLVSGTDVKVATKQLSAPNGARFFPICFTCGKHFKFVRLALYSLNRCDIPVGQISIFMDKGDPLSDLQRRQLQEESSHPIVFLSTKYPMASWGPRVQLSELEAYRVVASGMAAGDFLVKFDSDVLFLSDRTFRLVLKSSGGAVGTTVSKLHESEGAEEYMQGGCYFIRATELEAILRTPVAQASLAPTKWGEIPEDQFFSSLLRRCGVRPVYADFLYFEPIFIASRTKESDLIARLKALPPAADVLHFEGNKLDKVDRTNMKVAAEHFFGPLPPIANPYQ